MAAVIAERRGMPPDAHNPRIRRHEAIFEWGSSRLPGSVSCRVMRVTYLLPILCVAVLAVPAASAVAFEKQTNDPFAPSLSTDVPNSEQSVQNLSQQYTGNSATIFHSGNVTIGIIGPNRGYTNPDSPFVPDPSVGMVPSKRQW
ncbi:MAG: hypothetical protein ACREFC_10690 [Stellaceae bacterium]